MPQETVRLPAGRYLDLLHREGEALLIAAEGAMDRQVPPCPGWTVDDVVWHVGSVYAHKRAALRLGRRPEEGEWARPGESTSQEEDLRWCHSELHGLAADLARLGADAPAWTWWEPEQLSGFWLRRMALESAVHRADVESASGTIAPVDEDLALDGIDEVLAVLLAATGFRGTSSLTVDEGVVGVRIDDLTARGTASDVFLWLWGRAPDGAVGIDGTGQSRERVRELLREAMQ